MWWISNTNGILATEDKNFKWHFHPAAPAVRLRWRPLSPAALAASPARSDGQPQTFPAFSDRPEFDIHARIVPAREVGGDFYDFFFLDEDHLCFAIGDVSGKGVPAALFMAVTRTLLRATASTGRGPDAILSLLNRQLCRDNETCMFVTLFCGILDMPTGAVHYSNGGHHPPYVCTLEGNRSMPGAQGMTLGLVDEAVYQVQKVVLAPGEALFLYTDSVTEAMDGAGNLFTEARLAACLHRVGCLPGAALTQAVTDEVYAFVQGAPQSDDLTMLALRYLGSHRGSVCTDAVSL